MNQLIKQNISEEQINELNDSQFKNLSDYCKLVFRGSYRGRDFFVNRTINGATCVVLPLTIGEMIEFLGDQWFSAITWTDNGDSRADGMIEPVSTDEICDQLWFRVVLNLN